MNFEYSRWSVGRTNRVIIWPMFHFAENETEHLLEETEKLGISDFMLVPVEIRDWDHDLLPWEAPMADGSRPDAGGPDTLRWMEAELLPALKKEVREDVPFYIAGYSLAGLFALWSMYESETFCGAVSCSPSVWLDGWDKYAEERTVKGQGKYIYLSLGGKEEKTSNPMMAKVGDRIRQQEKQMKSDPHIQNVLLEWNGGGHFADSGKRLAKGIAKILRMADGEQDGAQRRNPGRGKSEGYLEKYFGIGGSAKFTQQELPYDNDGGVAMAAEEQRTYRTEAGK